MLLAAPVRAQTDAATSVAEALAPALQPEGSRQPVGASGDARVDRLEHVLRELATPVVSHTWLSIFSAIDGAAAMAIGTWTLVDRTGPAQDDSRVAGGVALMAIGASVAASGLYTSFVSTTTDDQRFERFRKLRASGRVDERAMARFEGELAAKAETARWQRQLSGASYIGVAAVGAAVIALAAADQVPRGSRGLAYTEGALLAALGVWQAIAKLAGSSRHEDAWRTYVADGGDGREASARVGVAPHSTGARLELSGNF